MIIRLVTLGVIVVCWLVRNQKTFSFKIPGFHHSNAPPPLWIENLETGYLLFSPHSKESWLRRVLPQVMVKSDDGSIVCTIGTWLRKLGGGGGWWSTDKHYCQMQEKTLEEMYESILSITKKTNKVWEKIPYNQILFTIITTSLFLGGIHRGIRRFRTATEIPLSYYKEKKKLRGYVISVNDSDNVRFYHQRLLSIGRPIIKREDLKFETINVRLAGVDAPEMGHFGGAPQPYAEEAKRWLTSYVQGKKVNVQVHRIDQYARAVATVSVYRYWFFPKNVSLAMVQAGYATLYNSAGAEYGGIKDKLMAAEKKARLQRLGMWKQSASEYVSPADYKRLQKSSIKND